jgi:hypothetical protein
MRLAEVGEISASVEILFVAAVLAHFNRAATSALDDSRSAGINALCLFTEVLGFSARSVAAVDSLVLGTFLGTPNGGRISARLDELSAVAALAATARALVLIFALATVLITLDAAVISLDRIH